MYVCMYVCACVRVCVLAYVCGYSIEPSRGGGSNEYPQPMSLSRNTKNNIYPCKPQFYYINFTDKHIKKW